MVNNLKETIIAGGVVLNQSGEVLVVQQRSNTWSLPKGHVEDGENELEAAKREIHEESGVSHLEFIRELGSYKRYKIGKDGREDDKSESKTLHLFLFKTKETVLKPLDPDNPQAIWVAREKVAELLTHPRDKEFFLGIMDEIKK